MNFHILTLFPDMVMGGPGTSITGRAMESKTISVEAIDSRDYSKEDVYKRQGMDLSQEELAELVGVTRQTIGMIEAGKYNPTLNLCLAICKALHKTLDELFWEE